MTVANILELVSESKHSWDDAVNSVLKHMVDKKSGITGIEVINWTAAVKDGQITSYKVNVKVAYLGEER